MMRWLRRFFYSDDPIVKVAAAMNKPEAEMWREMLENDGIPSMVKNITGGYLYEYGNATLMRPDFDLFVKQSDLERAREALGRMLEGHEPADAERVTDP